MHKAGMCIALFGASSSTRAGFVPYICIHWSLSLTQSGHCGVQVLVVLPYLNKLGGMLCLHAESCAVLSTSVLMQLTHLSAQHRSGTQPGDKLCTSLQLAHWFPQPFCAGAVGAFQHSTD